MTETVKMCDMDKSIVSKVFEMLNGGNVHLKETDSYFGTVIVTDVEPKELIYPEGWYYAKGTLRNKHTSTTGIYEEILFMKSNGDTWRDTATYCTLTD